MSHPAPDGVARLEYDFAHIGRREGPDFDHARDLLVDWQRSQIPLYDRYLSALGPAAASSPHLPIEAFRTHALCTFPAGDAEAVFVSSGTTSQVRSRHHVSRLAVYEAAIKANFERQLGCGPFTLAAHLPGYEEAGESSSLLYMVRCLIRVYGDEESGFFADRHEQLLQTVEWSRRYGTRLLLFGTAFGLLDLVEQQSLRLPEGAVVMETGGMKTRGREVQRSELHDRLAAGLGIARDSVLGEYGMTEMLSQCYTRGGEVFYPPGWVRIEIRDPEDPMAAQPDGTPGLIAVTDLANMYSISAILTQDIGVAVDGGVRVLGRLRGAELRGCNMLMEHLR